MRVACRLMQAAVVAAALCSQTSSLCRAEGLKAGAAAVNLRANDAMEIGGGIFPGHVKGQEGELRASALVVEDAHGSKVCLVACDVLMVNRDVLDRAAKRIETATGIPFEHVLINATHTHHAPTTVTVHGYKRDEAFTHEVEEQVVAAATAAAKRLTPVELLFRLGEESSVGRNSRLLLADGTIYWGGPREDVVRPTGPFDPELPVLAFRRPNGQLEAVLFNHSTHTIGTVHGAVRSPSWYGLAAQDLEAVKGGTFLFFEGASGSTHNLDLPAKEAEHRIAAAVSKTLAAARPRPVDRVTAVRSEFEVKVRKFDEADDDAVVVAYCTKRFPNPKPTIEVFRAMRKVLADQQGQPRKTWVQAVLIGDIAFVGVPGEFFTLLGEEIKTRSPYRYTYVFELANDYIGYIPDDEAYDRGGYQVWTGLHSFLARGTGEAIVDEAVRLLEQLHSASSSKTAP